LTIRRDIVPKAKTDTKKTSGKSKKKDSGAKLSKAFRNFGPLKELMNSDLGREILADVLVAAAGAAAVALTKSRSGKKAGTAAADAGTAAKDAARDAVQTAAGAVANVVTDAARHFLPASLLADDQKPAEARPEAARRRATPKPKSAAGSSTPKKRKAAARKTSTAHTIAET
jgi:hypothetical protein